MCTHRCRCQCCGQSTRAALLSLIFTLTLILAACLVFQSEAKAGTIDEVATSPDTFAVCKTVDIASTIYIVNSGIGYEANPLMAGLMHASVAAGLPWVLPIAASYGVYMLLQQVNDPTTTAIANGITCGVAASNLMLLP